MMQTRSQTKRYKIRTLHDAFSKTNFEIQNINNKSIHISKRIRTSANESQYEEESADAIGCALCDTSHFIGTPTYNDDTYDNAHTPSGRICENAENLITKEVRDSISPASNDLISGRAAQLSYPINLNADIFNEPNELNGSNFNFNFNNPGANEIQNLNLLRQYPDMYDDSTLLLDISPAHYGIFTGISSSLLFIPDHFIRKTRVIWNNFMQLALDDNSELNWKKLILLPIILFDCNREDNLNECKRKYGIKLEKLKNDEWNHFTLGSLSKKKNNTEPITENEIHAAATRLAEVGEIGKAYKKLKSDRNRIIPSQEVLTKLHSKFPIPGITDLSDDQIASISSYHLEHNENVEPIIANIAEIEAILIKSKNKVAHGLDHMRYEQLKQLWAPYSNNPSEGEFRNLFTSIINKIIQAQIPPSIVPIFQDIELLALPKGEEDIRPIGLQLILKKIACAICLKRTTAFNKEYFKSLQYCMSPLGTESVSLFFRAILESKPELDMWAKDGDNGFGRISRISGLYQTKEHLPELLPILKMIYGTSSNAWYMGLADGIEKLDSSEGCQQGDVLSMWFYAMAIHPFLQKIKNVLGNEGFTKWYADDGNTVAPFNKMVEVIRIVKDEGPKIGYYIKFSKGSYLIGKCETNEEAIQRKNILVNLGLNEETIHMHPDNDPENAAKFGCNILGSYIGSPTYIKSCLTAKLEKLKLESEVVKNYDNKQVQHLLLRLCFSQKINHLQRSLPPEYMTDFVKSFDSFKREILETIIGTRVCDIRWSQSCLSTSDGGLGYQDVIKMAYPAYISALVQCSSTLEEISPLIFSSNIPMMKSFYASIDKMNENAQLETDNSLTYEGIKLILIEAAKYKETLQSRLSDIQKVKGLEEFRNLILDTKYLAWCVSLSGKDSKSSRWLDVTPKSKEFSFNSDQFQALLCYRLMLQQPMYVPGTKCYCKRSPYLDCHGHHISAGCAKDGTLHKNHDAIKYVIKDLCNYSGFVTRLEEIRCFQDAVPESNLRPDISIYNFPVQPNSRKKMIIDISVTHPVPIISNRTLSRNEALQPCRAANQCYNRKEAKYREISTANNLEFLPIIFETTGKTHPKTESFFERLLTQMLNTSDPRTRSVLHFYWYARISCSIQKSIAEALVLKSRLINGGLTKINNIKSINNFLADKLLLLHN